MASEYRRFYPPSITQEEVDRLRRIEEDYHYKVNQVAKLERKLADKSPGSPLGRLSAIAVYAEENCGWSPIEARPPECAIRDRVEDLERQLSEAIARIAVEVEDNARDAAYIVKLERQLAEARKDEERWKARIALAIEATDCCPSCVRVWLDGELDDEQEKRVSEAINAAMAEEGKE